jgi:hypothetical protein
MAVQTVQNLPAQFVQDLGQDLAKQVASTIRCTYSIGWVSRNIAKTR